MRYGSLFSGYGGLDMGVQSVLGGSTAWHVEFDKAPSKILAHHWPDVPNYGDITAVDFTTVEPVDVLTGGFPCQDVSHAGRRAGLIRDGEGRTRSGLWGHMLRAITELRPRLVVAENVRGLLSATADSDMEPCPWCVGGAASGEPPMRALGAVLADLADVGYDAAWYGLRAADVGAAHGRFRVFIYAWPATDAPSFGRDGRARGHGQPDAGSQRPSRADAHGCVDAWDESLTLLPTPRAEERMQRNSRDAHNALSLEVTLLPTPTTADHGTDAPNRVGSASLSTDFVTRHLLPTPRATRGGSGTETMYGLGAERTDDDRVQGEVLLPTPRATDGTKGGPNQRGSSGDLMLPSAVNLLPTPTSGDSVGTGYATEWDELTDAEGRHRLRDAANLHATHQSWGDYAPAIARWESVIGRPAPAPTEPGPKGGHRLSPAFVEWLMGLPADHVTGVGLTRNEQLKALGNGVVPQQSAAATQAFLSDFARLEAIA